LPRLGPPTGNIVIGRLQAGQSQNEVGRTPNINQSTISRLWNIFQQTGSSNDRSRSERPRIATPGQDRYIRVFQLRNWTVSASTTAVGIPGLWRISSQTVRNRLRQHGIRPRRPYFGAVLKPLHRRETVRWCNRLRGWTFRNWHIIWVSDGTRFIQQKRDGRTRVYRHRNTRFSCSCVKEVDSYGGGSVMMWEAISNDSKTELVHVPGNLTAVRYRDEILQPYLMHVIDRQRELFQQDNATPHTARLAMDYLKQNTINVLPWPSKSPDWNPIESLRNHLDKRVHQRQPPPQTLDQLCQMLEQEWRTIPRNYIRELIESMPRRCRAVLAASGGHTRY
jgi:transposase